MAVQLISTTPAATVDLPSPSINSVGDANINQTLHRSAAGDVYTFQHGPERFTQDLTFIALSEVEHAALFAFFKTIGWQAVKFDYSFRDPRDGQTKTIECRMIGRPKNRRVSLNNNDVTVRLESAVEFNYENAT